MGEAGGPILNHLDRGALFRYGRRFGAALELPARTAGLGTPGFFCDSWEVSPGGLWTAGFDIIYSCQDYEFDVATGLFSLPRRIGIAGALRVAQGLHFLMVFCLLMLVNNLDLGLFALAGIVAVGLLLAYEHSLVKPDDLSRVNAAFFIMNGWVSVLFFVFWAADVFLVRRA